MTNYVKKNSNKPWISRSQQPKRMSTERVKGNGEQMKTIFLDWLPKIPKSPSICQLHQKQEENPH
jgi:hypothetical protein